MAEVSAWFENSENNPILTHEEDITVTEHGKRQGAGREEASEWT